MLASLIVTDVIRVPFKVLTLDLRCILTSKGPAFLSQYHVWVTFARRKQAPYESSLLTRIKQFEICHYLAVSPELIGKGHSLVKLTG